MSARSRRSKMAWMVAARSFGVRGSGVGSLMSATLLGPGERGRPLDLLTRERDARVPLELARGLERDHFGAGDDALARPAPLDDERGLGGERHDVEHRRRALDELERE